MTAWRRISWALVLAAPVLPAPAAGQVNAANSLQLAAANLRPGQYVWRDLDPAGGRVAVIVNVPLQRAFVYRGDVLVGVASVSTGRRGKETPIRAYTILEKRAFHRSNLYSNAPMPHMQRLTWDGIALHGGHNPGYPASHGCIRLPPTFAMLLYGATRLGGAVAVVDAGGMPVDTPAPLIVAEVATLDGPRFARVTWDSSPRLVDDDRWLVPEARLAVPPHAG